jgi:glucose/arabinose dehydrogenase
MLSAPDFKNRERLVSTSKLGFGTAVAIALMLLLNVGSVQGQALTVQKNDCIIILGNTFAERQHLFGYFETFLHSRFPDHQLRVRNMGWSADEVDKMIRPLGFPKLLDELQEHEVDLIFLCFGMNESFGGLTRVDHYKDKLKKFVKELQGYRFNGRSAPRIVLVSPIAYERLNDALAESSDHNRNLNLYSNAMAQVAQQENTFYLDLFSPTLQWMAEHNKRKLTFNGIHLSEYGDRVVSQMMAQGLGLIDLDVALPESGGETAETFRRMIYEKNYQFFNWWHPANASYIHGRRNRTPGAKHLTSERKQRQLLIENLDQRIWSMAKPKPSDVWRSEPVDGKPIWFPTPSDRRIGGVEKEPQMSVNRDGDGSTHLRSPAEQLKHFVVPDGYQVNLFASEVNFPIANPMAIQFDARGRLWVANSPTWPHSLPGIQPNDSIVILEDTDRDGVADKHSVFLDKMNLIHGFSLVADGAYVAQTPNLILARDTDGDNKADWLRVALQGFGAEDAEHSMNNFRWSPGGSLFFTQGIFFHTQVETPNGPRRVRDAAVFRYQPHDQQLGVYVSHHFYNPYGNLFGRWGRGIVLDASAGHYYPMDVLSANFNYPKRKEEMTDHLSFAPGGSIAAGCDWLSSRHFPPGVQGRFLVNHCEGDVGTHWYTLSNEGTLYKAKRNEPPLLTSSDRTFRPVAMSIGPDGAVYIVDFYSDIFENVNFSKRHPGRDHCHGRIWRITHKSRPLLEPPKIVDQPVPKLLNLLKAHEYMTRELARRELQQRGRENVVPHLKKWIETLDPSEADYEHHLVEALWVCQGLDAIDVDLLTRLLNAKQAGARIAATHVLRFWQDRIDGSIDLLAKRINDPDPRVRLQAVLACGFSKSPNAMENALGAAEYELDPGLKHALNQTMDYFEELEKRKKNQ